MGCLICSNLLAQSYQLEYKSFFYSLEPVYQLFIFSICLNTKIPPKYYNYYSNPGDFHTNVIWWPSTGIWVIASLFRFPGLFSVFWPTLAMLLFGWFFLWFPIPSVFFPSLLETSQLHQLKLVPALPSSSTAFLVIWQGGSICFTLFYFHSLVRYNGKINLTAISFFLTVIDDWEKKFLVDFYILLNLYCFAFLWVFVYNAQELTWFSFI